LVTLMKGAGTKETHVSGRKPESDFERGARARPHTFLGELWGFVSHNKKWWMLPIIVVLLLMGVMVLLGGTGVAPFIYALF
jgi:hypothetical protein